MLGEEEKREIEAERARYPGGRAAAIDALRIVQQHHGWLSDASLAELSHLLGVPVAELESVASFYNLLWRKPVGRHVVFVCDSVSCWTMGYRAIRARLEERLGISLGETTADGRFTLLPIVCLGACERAPVLMIDGDLHPDLRPEDLDAILEKYA
jgi:NADH-quinone oxidoreductase subunit E